MLALDSDLSAAWCLLTLHNLVDLVSPARSAGGLVPLPSIFFVSKRRRRACRPSGSVLQRVEGVFGRSGRESAPDFCTALEFGASDIAFELIIF